MFFQLLYIHLFRPFLKYNHTTSPLPAHVSPRKICTQAAAMISKLVRLYKRSHGLRQIVNLSVYMLHSACTIHLLNLPEKTAIRDITHGVKHLEEIAEGWLCARRTLAVLSVQARNWKIELPEDAAAVLVRTDAKFSAYSHISSLPKSPEEPPRPAPVPHQPAMRQESGMQQQVPLLRTDNMYPVNPAHQTSIQTRAPQHLRNRGSISEPARMQMQPSRRIPYEPGRRLQRRPPATRPPAWPAPTDQQAGPSPIRHVWRCGGIATRGPGGLVDQRPVAACNWLW